MAITTLDGALQNAMQPQGYLTNLPTGGISAGLPFSSWFLSPGAASAPANTAGGTVLSSSSAQVPGQIYRKDPASGNAYLSRFSGINLGQTGMLLLCDRLLQCAGTTAGTAISVTTTTAQTVNTTTLPARDALGTTQGIDVQAAVEVVSQTSAGSPTLTIGYTNNFGTAGQTVTGPITTAAARAVGTFFFLGLAAGSYGVRSIQTYTQSATWTSGTLCLVLFRVLAALELESAGSFTNAVDALTSGFPQLYNGTVPFVVMIPSVTTATTFQGMYMESQG